jgi:hypothetical protein
MPLLPLSVNSAVRRLAAIPALLVLVIAPSAAAQPDSYAFPDAQRFLKTYCAGCHQGKSPLAGFNTATLAAADSFHSHPQNGPGL